MKVDNLVTTLVANENYERSMILLDIIVDEDRYPWIELFSHRDVTTSVRLLSPKTRDTEALLQSISKQAEIKKKRQARRPFGIKDGRGGGRQRETEPSGNSKEGKCYRKIRLF